MQALGLLLLRIWSVVRTTKLLTMVFIKGLALTLCLFILPRVIAMGIFRFKEKFLPILLEKISPYMDSVTGQNIGLQLTDLGGWLANQMDIVNLVSLMISGSITFLALKLVLGKN